MNLSWITLELVLWCVCWIAVPVALTVAAWRSERRA